MKKKRTRWKILASVVFLALNFSVARNCESESQEKIDNQSKKTDMIIIYKKGKEIKIAPDSPSFNELKTEIENLTINSDDAYKLIPDEDKITNMKKKSLAVELLYASPKELEIKFFKKTLSIINILIPLKDDYFPKDSILAYEITHKDFPHTLANTKQSKDKLHKLIETLESK